MKVPVLFPKIFDYPFTYKSEISQKLNPGDFIIHHSAVIHGSKKNKSNQNREGLVISYKTIDAKVNKKKLSFS